MSLFDQICTFLGVSAPVGKFLLTFLASLPLSLLFNSTLFFSRNATLRHAFSGISGAVLSYIAFGFSANLHFAFCLILTYMAMIWSRKNCGSITFFGTFAFLIACHVWYISGESWKEGGIDFTGALMILTLKVISVAIDYQDGQLSDEKLKTETQRNRRLSELPSLLEFVGFSLNCGTHFAGPVYGMKDYLTWQRSEGVWDPKQPRPPPSPYLPALRALLQAFLSASIHLYLESFVDLSFFPTEKYKKSPLWLCWFYMFLAAFSCRWKYYFIWSISESSLILSGLGFSGWKEIAVEREKKEEKEVEGEKKKKKKEVEKKEVEGEKKKEEEKEVEREKKEIIVVAKWDRARNCNILGVELADSAIHFPLNWNISVSNWLRIYVYERLTPKGKKSGFWELLGTQVVSAIWHGLYPGYLHYFVGSALMIAGSRVIYRFQKQIPSKQSTLFQVSRIFHFFYASFVNNYAAAGFLLLYNRETLLAYKGVYFLGTILPIAILMLGAIIPPPKASRPKKEQ